MNRLKKHNRGFSLIELLIAIAILSIIMIMVVQFMSTTSGAYQRNKKNLNIQTDSMQIMEQITDTIMQAKYIRVETMDTGMYELEYVDSSSVPKRNVNAAADTTYESVTYDLVPDNYGNYCDDLSYTTNGRKTIVDFDDYKIYSDKKSANKLVTYPLSSDDDYFVGNNVRSFRALKSGSTYRYVKPRYIYVEYPRSYQTASGVEDKTVHVLYHITGITDDKDDTCSIFMVRYETDSTQKGYGYQYAKTNLDLSYLTSSADHSKEAVSATTYTSIEEGATVVSNLKHGWAAGGLVTNKIADFYLSADSDGNAILFDVMFRDGGYQYHVADTVVCRNSDVLTVRPQKLYKLKNGTITGGGSSEDSSSEEGSSEETGTP